MTKRRTITAALERRIIMAQLAEGLFKINVARFAAFIQCPLCGDTIEPDDPVIHEHMTSLCMGGTDDETNIRLVHKQCADRKTNGTKATTAGSDIHAIAKVRRLRGETGQRKWKRTWPPGRKLQGRAWERRSPKVRKV